MKIASTLRRIASAIGWFALAIPALPIKAETVYFDDFNDQQNIDRGGSYTQSLGGSVPTIRSGTRGGSTGATWTFNAETGGWGQRDYGDNNVATPTSSNYLAFTPQAGYIYTLEADITVNTTINGNWFAIGFVQSPTNWVVNGAYTVVDYDTITEQGIVRWQAPNVGVTRRVRFSLDTTAPGWTNTQNIGYVGWFTAGPGGVNLNSLNQVSIDNFRLTAGVANPTLTYDGNGSDGGAVPTDGSSPYTHGATATVLGAGTMTRAGFNFIGWNTAADGSGTNYAAGATFTIRDNTTLYARWLPTTLVTLTYDGNGSTGGSAPTDANSPYTSGSTATVLGAGSLTKVSHSFSHWNTAADGSGTSYNPGDTFAVNANTTLFARWAPGPDYVWDNGAATDAWNTSAANWSGATWTNSASSNAFFRSVGGSVFLDPGIVAGAVNVGNTAANFASLGLVDGGLSATSLTVQGLAINGGNYGANPTLSVDSAVTLGGDAAVGRASLSILGGTFTANRIISAPASADWGRLVVSGGTVTATNGVDGSVNTGATFAIDLNGGELRAPSVRVANREFGTNNSAWLSFNGGTLKAIGANNPNFITTYGGGQNTYVGSGGAIIDTNGFDIGIPVNLLNGGGGGLTKEGAGTLTLGGSNTYVGDTTVNAGTLVLADNAQLRFVVNDTPATNVVTGTGAAVFNGDFVIDTAAVSGNTGFIWTLVDRATLNGESFDAATFSVVGFSDIDDDGVWTMTDAKGDWSFSEATGELTLDVGNDYDDWGAPYGLATGSEAGDLDNDGLTNQQEYAFGLLPNSGASVNPIVVPLDKTTGTFRYTRRATPATTGLTYTVWTSTDLATWTEDTTATASQSVIGTVGEVQTVEATISGSLPLAQPKLFVQVRAN